MELLKIAASQLGTKEISGSKNNPQILKYAKETGIKNINTDEIPWCSTFINWCAKEAGLPMSKKANARSWIHVGIKTTSPEASDIVVFWRQDPMSWKGHVAIFLGFNNQGNKVICLGGNQSNAVTISEYDANKVITFRKLEKSQAYKIPTPVLKKGSKGQEVIKLQLILNHLDYNCGDADGDFGNKTESALKSLQANNHLTINGVYQIKSKSCLESLMQE